MGIEVSNLSNDDLDFALDEYKEAKIEEPIPETSESIIQNLGTDSPPAVPIAIGTSQNEPPPDATNWEGDNRFYQTGKKRGTLRPKPKVSASYNMSASTSIPASMLINGAMFLMVVNIIFPLVIVAVNNWLSPKEKMTVKDMKLTKEEAKEVEPLMEATLKQLNINGNPLILLCITLTASYAGKFMTFKLGKEFDEKEETKKEEKK